jgi:nicotinamidase/pyrazinamidase
MHAPPPRAALLAVDLQNDFMPGGALGVSDGHEVIAPLNRAMRAAAAGGVPIFLTRDWHPPDHCSFRARGGPWPPHCVAGTAGAAFAGAVDVMPRAVIVSKATTRDAEAYSALNGTGLAQLLRDAHVERLLLGGLATDYCVRATALDALETGFSVLVLQDACRAVDVHAGDGQRALDEIVRAGAVLTTTDAAIAMLGEPR